MRTVHFELVPDPGSFTPLQLKPVTLLSACFNGSQRWSKAYGVPLQIAVENLQTGFVIQVARLRYMDRYTHTNLEEINVSVTRCSLKDGAQVEIRAIFEAQPGFTVAEASLCVVPLHLADHGGELAGLPAPLSAAYLQYFDPSERLSEPYPSPFPAVLNGIVEHGDLLGSYEHPFFLHRQHCEHVDQWYFVEAVNFAAASRERMVFEQGAKVPALRRGLSLPVREVDALYNRPFYLFDQGRIRTRAYRGQEGVIFVHELLKDDPGEPHALVVERF